MHCLDHRKCLGFPAANVLLRMYSMYHVSLASTILTMAVHSIHTTAVLYSTVECQIIAPDGFENKSTRILQRAFFVESLELYGTTGS